MNGSRASHSTEATASGDATLRPVTNTAKILVVDDSDFTRGHITRTLIANGYHVEEARDGLDALQKVSSTRFDAILLDLVMPNVDGWQFRETQLRHPELARIPTVIVTVKPLRKEDQYALRTPYVVLKPFNESTLLTALQRAAPRRAAAWSPSSFATATSSPDQLFWSRRGAVACAEHAPPPDSTAWRDERWAAIPSHAGKHGVVYQCQHCGGGTGPIKHVARNSE
jgi:CheY-like chemotaxis protein